MLKQLHRTQCSIAPFLGLLLAGSCFLGIGIAGSGREHANKGLPAPRMDGNVIVNNEGSLTRGEIHVAPSSSSRRVLLDEAHLTVAACRAKPRRSFEQLYDGWQTEAIRARYDELVSEYVEGLDRVVEARFRTGDYESFQRGDAWNGSAMTQDRIIAVRTPLDGLYQGVVLEPTEAPRVYELQAESAWLHGRLGLEPSG